MESKNGALLTKIAASINFILAGIFFIIILFSWNSLSSIESDNFFLVSGANAGILFVLFLGLMVLFGFLFLVASRRMKNPNKVKGGAIMAIVFGVISFANISGVLALIGGVLGLVDSGKNE